MSSAAAYTEACQNFLKQARIPNLPEVYLGCLERCVTVYSQQVPALNLIYALEQCAGLQPGARIGIVGAGIYTDELKASAVALVLAEEKTVAQVARDLDLTARDE